MNTGFVRADMHSPDLVLPDPTMEEVYRGRFKSSWFKGMAVLIFLSSAVAVLSLIWAIFIKTKGKVWPVLGGGSFQKKVLKREPKKVVKKPIEVETKGKTQKLGSWLIAASLLSLPALSWGDNLYLDMVKKAVVSEKDTREAEKKLRELKDIKIQDPLPLKPFHERVPHPKPQTEEGFCLICHKGMPHGKNEVTRTFLNMHTGPIACETCHFRPEKVAIEYRWFSELPIESEGNELNLKDETTAHSSKIMPFHTGEAVQLFNDHPYSKDMKERWEKIPLPGKADLKARIHKPLSEKGPGCPDCHKDGKRFLDLAALGFSPKEVKMIEQNKIARFVGKIRRKEERIRIRELLD